MPSQMYITSFIQQKANKSFCIYYISVIISISNTGLKMLKFQKAHNSTYIIKKSRQLQWVNIFSRYAQIYWPIIDLGW